MKLIVNRGADAAKKIADEKCLLAVFEANRPLVQEVCERHWEYRSEGVHPHDITVDLSKQEIRLFRLLGMFAMNRLSLYYGVLDDGSVVVQRPPY